MTFAKIKKERQCSLTDDLGLKFPKLQLEKVEAERVTGVKGKMETAVETSLLLNLSINGKS